MHHFSQNVNQQFPLLVSQDPLQQFFKTFSHMLNWAGEKET